MNNGDKLLQNWDIFSRPGRNAKYNLLDLVSYDFDRTMCTGRCDDCCRCTSIIDFEIKNINLNSLQTALSEDIDNEIFIYCIDRLLQKSKLNNPNNWTPNITNGYYGEELDGIELDPSILLEFEQSIKKLAGTKTDFERIKVVLEAEYQYLLPKLLEKDFEVQIKEVESNLISVGNDEYMMKIDSKNVEYIENYTLPRAVCFEQGGKYRVIDGYHRTTAALKNKDRTIKIVLLTEK